MSLQQRQTADAQFMAIQDDKVGAIEFKPFNTPEPDIDNSLACLGVVTKRILHRRMLVAKSIREFKTDGILIYVSAVDYYIHEYYPSKPLAPAPAPAPSAKSSISATPAEPLGTSNTHLYFYQTKHVTDITKHIQTHDALSEYLMYFEELTQDRFANVSGIGKLYHCNDTLDQSTSTVTLLKLG